MSPHEQEPMKGTHEWRMWEHRQRFPIEAAQEVVNKCEHVPEFDEFALRDHMRANEGHVPQVACRVCIASALAASAAKVSELEGELAKHEGCIAEIQADQLAMVERENEIHDALTAKLEASEREVESWKIMADNMRVRSEASERARKQVTEYAMRTVTLTGWDDDGATTPIDPRLSWESVARLALDYAMAALASPEARATGEESNE